MALKSFTIKIGADTKEFNKGLREADKAINSTVKQGKALQKSLELEFDPKKLQTAQKLAQNALDLTNQKVQSLKDQLKFLEETGAIDTNNYYDLQTKLAQAQLKAEDLSEELEKINNLKFTNITNNLDNISGKLTKAGQSMGGLSVAAGGAIAGMFAISKSTVSANAELQDYVDRLGISAEALQKWYYIAMQSGVENETLNKSFAKLRTSIGTIIAGQTSTASKAVQELIGDVSKLPSGTEEAFEVLARAIANVEDETLKAYYANSIFGERIATDLLPMLNRSTAELDALGLEFESIGYLSGEQVQALADFDDQLNIMNSRITEAKYQLGVAFLPILEIMIDLVNNYLVPAMKGLAEWFDKLPSSTQNVVIGLLGVVTILSPLLLIGGKVVGMVSSLIKSLPSLTKIITLLNTPLGRTLATVAALSAVVGMLVGIIEQWGNMNAMQKIISVLGTLTVVALGAAVALGAFHSAWSLGLAVAGIVAGIVAVTAAVNSAKNSIDTNIPDIPQPSLSGSSSYDMPNYDVNGAYGNVTNNSDNSQVTNNITINAPNADANEVYDIISKKLAIKVQARS